jgi:hypothetical protein
MKKNFLVLLLVLGTMLSPCVLAESDGIKGTISDILDIGRLEWLLGGSAENQLIGFIRIIIAILIFTMLYLGLSVANNAMGGNAIPKNIAITIGILMAIVSAVFIPGEVLMMFGETYATIFSLIIIGGPILAILSLCFMTPTPGRGMAFLKFCAICFVIWLIDKITDWAAVLSNSMGVL